MKTLLLFWSCAFLALVLWFQSDVGQVEASCYRWSSSDCHCKHNFGKCPGNSGQACTKYCRDPKRGYSDGKCDANRCVCFNKGEKCQQSSLDSCSSKCSGYCSSLGYHSGRCSARKRSAEFEDMDNDFEIERFERSPGRTTRRTTRKPQVSRKGTCQCYHDCARDC
ncbi:hypothetical protein Ddc_09950 [Ditylenchus destructor]|nr:hypothetical protein Ddc_09950 [Ditylenchus destructor]